MIVNYFEVAANFELAPAEALAFFQAKGLKATFDWRDQLGDEHDLALTVAKMMDLDLLHTVKGRLDSALENGDSLADFKRELIPELQKAGWWGKRDVIDPQNGQVVTAQLGSASRLETIFRTNLQSAYSVGRWQAIEEQADTAPYLMYDAVDDHRTRPEHAALDGLVLTVDDPYWNSHAPSNGWNCRCGLIQLDDDQLRDHGLREGTAPRVKTRKWLNPRTGDVHKVPTDLDPGWDHNPGKKRYEQLKALAAEKAQARYEAKAQAKLAEAQAKIDASVANYQAKLAKLSADAPAIKGKLAAQAQKYAQAELDYHLENKTPCLAQAIKSLQKTKSGQAMTPGELLSAAQEKALVIEQSAHLSAFKAKSIAGKPISAKQQAVFDGLPDEAQASILADIDAKTGVAQAKADLQKIADYDADEYASTKAALLPADWQNHPDPKALLAQIEAEGNAEGSASAWLFEHEMAGTPYIAQAIKQLKGTQAGNLMSASELADAVKTKAAKLEQSAHLSAYKAKSIAGKEPSDKQKAAFAALPEEAQASMSADIFAKITAKAIEQQKQADNQAALEALDLIAQGQAPELPGIQKSILAKINADPELLAKYPEPVDLLQAVQTQAVAQQAKATQGTLKSGYKKKALAGHIPTPKQQAMFDALTDEEQAELLAEIDEAKAAQAKAADKAADKAKVQAAMDAASEAAKKDKDPDDISGIFAHLIDEVMDDESAQAKLQAGVDKLLDGHKHAASLGSLVKKLTGDQPGDPTPKQAAKYAALAPEDQAIIDALVIAKGNIKELGIFKKAVPEPKAKAPSTDPDAAPVTTPTTPEPKGDHPLPALDDLTQIGGQGGSNPGGTYQDTQTGTKWYIKTPQTANHAKNEVLTGKLYAAAGVDVAEMHYRKDDGKTRIYSKIIDGLVIDAPGLQAGTVKNVQDNFMVDAWLANWDVVGMGYDNLKVLNNKAIHIDTGAGLLYRAQGEAKGAHFGDVVGEIDSLRDAGLNAQAAATFKHLTHADEIAGARKVLSVDQQTITDLVEQYGPGDAQAKAVMVKRLLARQADIAQRYPEATKKLKPVPVPKATRVTEQELVDIKAARVNGVALATDKDQIEDQNVLLWHKRNLAGKATTGALLKVRGQTAQAINALTAQSTGATVTLATLGDLGPRIKELVIGVNAQAGKGLELRPKDMARLAVVRDRFAELLPKIKAATTDQHASDATKAQAFGALQYLGSWQKQIEQATDGLKAGDKAKTIGSEWFDPGKLPTSLSKYVPANPDTNIQFKKVDNSYTLADFDRSHQVEKNEQYELHSEHYLGELDGALVRYWPDDDSTPFALRGRLQIEVAGQDTTASAKPFEVLDRLGVDSTRASLGDQEALYLQRIAYRYQVDKQMNAAASSNAERRAWLESKLNTTLEGAALYRPDGQLQKFEHGRRHHYDPVLQAEKGWQQLTEDYLLHHQLYNGLLVDLPRILAGGGQMAPSTDKIRRGVPFGGMSPVADLKSGGASYFFTRLLSRQSADSAGVGLKWKPTHAARLDAIHYDHDAYGRVDGDYVPKHNKHTGGLTTMKQAAKNGGNEMIFKDGMSLFEDLDHIKAGGDRKAVIQIFKDHGYDEWPDGRKLEEVIKR